MLHLNKWSPDPYIVVLTGMGFLIALVAWLPLAIKRVPLSLPIVCIALGAALFSVPQVTDRPLPLAYPEITERFTEFVVIIALMGAGLKLDRVFSWRRWSVAWRLLALTMPLTIAAITLIGAWWIGLPWIIALLLGASLAPTDPVLAADVQVGPCPAIDRARRADRAEGGMEREADARLLRDPRGRLLLLPGLRAQPHGGGGGERLWAIVALVVLLSVLLHGLTVTPIMRTLDRRQGRDPDTNEATPPPGLQGPAT